MALKKYVKATGERKRYRVDYDDWLDVGETLTLVTFVPQANTTAPLLVVDGIAIEPGARSVQYYVSGGVDGVTYEVIATATTSGGQIKEASLLFTIREP